MRQNIIGALHLLRSLRRHCSTRVLTDRMGLLRVILPCSSQAKDRLVKSTKGTSSFLPSRLCV